MCEMVLCIPTFRRDALLRALLPTLLPDLTTTNATLIVADNACSDTTKAIVENFRTTWPHCHYVAVPDRGLACVRNAMIGAATRIAPAWEWLVMLDDDGLVSPGWMPTLINCGRTYGAQLVGGPVEGVLPEGANLLARNSIFASRRRFPTGPVATLNTTQNLAVSRSLIGMISPPLFSLRWNVSGGEDYDLFRRTAKAGGLIAWCDEAVVHEPAPASRLTNSAVLGRYWTTGKYMAAIDASYDGWGKTAGDAMAGLARSFARSLLESVRGNAPHAAKAILQVAHYAGRIMGLLGSKSLRYVAASDSSSMTINQSMTT